MSYIAINGTDLFYQVQGEGEPILFIHGTGMSSTIWGEAPGDLATQHKVVLYDRRGHSDSSGRPTGNYHTDAEDAATLLNGLKLARATIVGWSAGGIIALDLAINHPELVSSLVIYEPPLHAKKHPDLGLVKTLIKVTLQRRRDPERAAETFLRYALGARTGGSAWDRWPESWQQLMRDNAAATLADLAAGTGEHLTRATISAIQCPVTCLWGSMSQPFLTNATLRLLRLLPQAHPIEITHGSHGLHVDHREEFVAAVSRSIAGSTRI
jgi:pimeloyl-ACP methyl ester carboxylesterase